MLDQPEKTKANGRSPASGKSTAASRPAARGRKRAARPDESQHPEGNVSDSNPFSPDGHSKSLGDAKDEEENPDDDEGVDDDDDSTCAICGSPKCTRKNSIVFCDGEGCDVPVHQKCYDVKELPPEEEKWFCQRCEDGVVVESTRVLCCPLTTGALKRTDQSGGYVHVNCGLWNPAISTNNPQKWTVGLDEIHREPCTLCSVAEGYTIRCVYDDDEADTEDAGCDHFFHVTCAIESGLITVTSPPTLTASGLLCNEHRAQRRSSRRGRPRQSNAKGTATKRAAPSTEGTRSRRPQKRKLVRKTSSASVDLDPIAGSPRKRGRAILHDEDDEDEDDNDGVSDDDERFQEKGTPSPSFKHKKPTPKDEVPLPDRPQSPRESDSAIIAESAKLAPGNSPSPTPPPRPPPASDTVKTGPTDNALPIPESASLLSKAPISGVRGPKPMARPLVKPTRPTPLTRRPISTLMSSLTTPPAATGSSTTTLLSGSLVLPSGGAKTEAEKPAPSAPRSGSPSGAVKKPSFLRSSAPIHANMAAVASSPIKSGKVTPPPSRKLSSNNTNISVNPSGPTITSSNLLVPNSGTSYPASSVSTTSATISASSDSSSSSKSTNKNEDENTESGQIAESNDADQLPVDNAKSRPSSEDMAVDEPASSAQTPLAEPLPEPSEDAKPPAGRPFLPSSLRKSALQTAAHSRRRAGPSESSSSESNSTSVSIPNVNLNAPASSGTNSSPNEPNTNRNRSRSPGVNRPADRRSGDWGENGRTNNRAIDRYRSTDRPLRSDREHEGDSDRTFDRELERHRERDRERDRERPRGREWNRDRERGDVDGPGPFRRQNSLSQGGNFRDKERETGGNAGGFQRMELIDEYQVGKPPARSDGGDNGNRGPPPRNRKPVSAAASLFYNGHGENPAVGSGPAPTNSGPGSSLANGAGEGQLIPDDRLNFLIQSMAEMKERINQTDYLTQKQAEAVLPSVTTLNRFADLQRENAQLQSEIIHWKTEADAACRETDRANLALDQLRKHITAILTVCALPIDDGTPSVDGPSSPVVATIDLRVAQLAENITRLVQVPELVSQDQRNTDVDRLVDSWLQETRVPDEKMAVENP